MKRALILSWLLLAIVGSTAFSQAYTEPIDSLYSYKKIKNTVWAGDSVWVGGSLRNPVYVTIIAESSIDTLLVCGNNDTTRGAWLRIPPNIVTGFQPFSTLCHYKFLRRKVITSTDSVQTKVTSKWLTP